MDLQHLRASDGTGEAVLAHVDAQRSIGATVLALDSTDNWNSKAIIITGTVGASGFISPTGMTVMYGTISGTDFTIEGFAPGYTDNGNETTEVAIVKMCTSWADALVDILGISLATDGTIKAPQGFIVNGKIQRTVASNNLTIALKTIAGTDPSTSNPVYCRIGDTIRKVTAALSITLNAGTNWFNAGSTPLATNEVDYFIYLGYNATDGVTLALARHANVRVYSEFSTTTTSDKYGAVSTVTHAASTDEYEVIGRVNATLSAGAGYTWSVPATSVVVNRPIFHTRWLTFTVKIRAGTTDPTLGSGGTNTGKYQITNDQLKMLGNWQFGSSGMAAGTGTYYIESPFVADVNVGTSLPITGMLRMKDSSGSVSAYGHAEYDTTVVGSLVAGQCLQLTHMSTGAASGNPIGVATTSGSAPWTWAASDTIDFDLVLRMNL